MNNRDSILKNLRKVFPTADTIDLDTKGWPYEVNAVIVGAELTQTSTGFLALRDLLEARVFGGLIAEWHEDKATPERNDSMGRTEPGAPSEIRIKAVQAVGE